jgi:glycine/D-amino acid oxidase-like deaminating enzyme
VAGGLLALELAGLGLQVQLLDDGSPDRRATGWSYGAIAPWVPQLWRRLQDRHGDLGWGGAWFRPLGGWLALPLPCSRVDVVCLQQRLPQALAAAGVICSQASVEGLEPPQRSAGPWRLRLRGLPEPLQAHQVVLAAGAGCRALWPALPASLRVSWAGVLLLQAQPGGWPWAGPAAMRLPGRFSRLALEARAGTLEEESWQVDPGLLPWGERWLAGQISLVRPGLDAGAPPDARLQEQRLRRGLAPLLPALAHWPGHFQQVPVSFCCDGQPLAGPVAGAPGLWTFAGFGAAFTAIPPQARGLALRLAAAMG